MTPAALARLHASCFTVPRPWSAAEFASLLAMPGVFLLAEPAGFALGRVAADEAELLTLAVDPATRRQGAGRRLADAFLTEAARRGAARAHLEVAAGNAAARALYHAAGWAEAGLRRGYHGLPDGARGDAVTMSRDIVQPDAGFLTNR